MELEWRKIDQTSTVSYAGNFVFKLLSRLDGKVLLYLTKYDEETFETTNSFLETFGSKEEAQREAKYYYEYKIERFTARQMYDFANWYCGVPNADRKTPEQMLEQFLTLKL